MLRQTSFTQSVCLLTFFMSYKSIPKTFANWIFRWCTHNIKDRKEESMIKTSNPIVCAFQVFFFVDFWCNTKSPCGIWKKIRVNVDRDLIADHPTLKIWSIMLITIKMIGDHDRDRWSWSWSLIMIVIVNH